MCRVFVGIFAAFYVLALAVFLIGLFGLFGNEQDPLSAAFLIPLGMPWVMSLDWFPDGIRPWLAAGAPAINLAILYFACQMFRSRKSPPT